MSESPKIIRRSLKVVALAGESRITPIQVISGTVLRPKTTRGVIIGFAAITLGFRLTTFGSDPAGSTTLVDPAPGSAPTASAGLLNDFLRHQSDGFNPWDLGGQVRGRFEAKSGFAAPGAGTSAVDFSRLTPDNNYWLFREKIHAGYTPASWVTLYAEGRNSATYHDKRMPEPEEDSIDLQQGYLTLGDARQFPFTLKVGRQELTYGDERLVGASDWSNIGRVCQLFTGLPLADLENIAAVSTVKSLDKGAYLFHEGDPARGFYVVQLGAVNVHRVSATGKEQVIHVFRAGDSFAEVALASEQGYPADARALEPSQVLLVQKAGILALLRRQPELALRMLGSMSSHLRVLVSQLEDLTLRDVETRLANWLVKRCPDPAGDRPVQIQLTMTKRVLAAELGTVSETFSRTLAKFREQKLLMVNGKTVTILSPVRLSMLLRRNLGE